MGKSKNLQCLFLHADTMAQQLSNVHLYMVSFHYSYLSYCSCVPFCFSLSKGSPGAFLPIFHYAFIEYSRHVTEKISALNIEMYGKADLRFIECMYKVSSRVSCIALLFCIMLPILKSICVYIYMHLCAPHNLFNG